MTITEMLLIASIIGALTLGLIIGIVAGIERVDDMRRKCGWWT